MHDRNRITPTIEEYLETMQHMASEGKAIIAARLAETFRVSAPTVTATLRRMERDGLITSNHRREVRLTQKGLLAANNIVRRHRLAERLLTDMLRIPWHEAHKEACSLEHGISDKVMETLYEVLGQPATCPHGNPIPVSDALVPLKGVPLDTVGVGSIVVVERISEEGADIPELLAYLQQGSIKPGAVLSIEEIAPYAGTMKVHQKDREFALGTKAAASVWVTPLEKP
ncbi:MAG: metal-dependent transcriptional regulator [Chloroflexi bacterium]|nr:metal-dependent transcriptional regulator [Chloroflexota bacterium]